VLQESGYALHGGKELILLREPGVEVFGLQGDLEYIPFDVDKLAEVFSKLNQMIHGLLQKAAGTEVKTIVAEVRQQKEAVIEQAPVAVAPAAEEKASQPATESDPIAIYIEMTRAAEKRDFESLARAWEAGGNAIRAGKNEDLDSLAWDSLYFECRFEAGAADSLESLRELRLKNPARPEPALAIARCLASSGEYEVAAGVFLEAAQVQMNEEQKARALVRAADAFRQGKQYKKGKKAIYQALSCSAGVDVREEAIWVQYQLLRDSKKDYFAFAAAEAALHDNPLFRLRFTLGLDYHRKNLNALALSHFKFLHERNKEDSSSLHNLALMYSDCKLPITSVEQYKQALSKGETLSAANLGFLYLDAGMADEARALVQPAMQVERHDNRVEKCLAAIIQRREQEKDKETELLEKANIDRGFLAKMGNALQRGVPSVDGIWRFPFGEMPLALTGRQLAGSVDIESEVSGFGLLFGTPGQKLTRKDRYTLSGKMKNSVCEFEFSITDVTAGSLAVGSFREPKAGFIVFAEDAKSATYVELKDSNFEKAEILRKVS